MVLNEQTTVQDLCLKSADMAFSGMDTENVVCSQAAIQTFDDVFWGWKNDKFKSHGKPMEISFLYAFNTLFCSLCKAIL